MVSNQDAILKEIEAKQKKWEKDILKKHDSKSKRVYSMKNFVDRNKFV